MVNTRLALQKRLLDLVTTDVVEWENTDFTAPSLSTPYYKAYMLNAGVESLATDTMESEILGIFQITLLFPTDSGTIPLETKAQEIMNHFVGQSITESDTKVRIVTQPYFTMLSPTNDRFIGAVRIPFKSIKI